MAGYLSVPGGRAVARLRYPGNEDGALERTAGARTSQHGSVRREQAGSTVTRTSPTIIINPRDDGRFGELLDRSLLTGVESPDALERLLREVYPRAVVRRRELAGEQVEVWYVYREGRWVSGE